MAHISIFFVEKITAKAGTTVGAPLKIEACGEDGTTDNVTIFTENQALTNDLAEAINTVMAKHAAPKLEVA